MSVFSMTQNEETIENDLLLQKTTAKRCRLPRGQTDQSAKKICAKEIRNACIKKVSTILQKIEEERTLEENQVLFEYQDVVGEVLGRWRKREAAKKRLEELEDPEDVLNAKCQILAQAIAQAQHLIVYTGAGISTAAKIPDYRGPNGIWTRLQQGKDIGDHDLTLAEPTYTHMALSELYRKQILKYVVSQNCDGLHLRSGLPRTALSELHGNMYIEVCKHCKPHREYWRLFDVTENTARYAHKTFRRCYICSEALEDTIVHFGERGSLAWPLNWAGACKNAAKATTIVCLGSSLKVLKKYPWLWQMDKPVKKRPNLYIVNLQWTPKDDFANIKINGKCDEIMRKVMDILGINVTKYERFRDPIYAHATELQELESHTTSQPFLKIEKIEDASVVQKEDWVDNSDLRKINSYCDNSNNINRQCLLKKKTNPPSKFSIDSLLQPDRVHSFSVSNTNLSLFSCGFQMFSTYPDFFLYPYQTSFLYSGLHSIINPLPMYRENLTLIPKEEQGIVEPPCKYCNSNYNTMTCLFYPRAECAFLNQKYRYSKVEKKEKPNICLCCDYSTDEDESDNSADVNKKIQAGWFGKGYRKSRKTKRKVL